VELNEMGAVIKALPHLARPCDRVAKEVLAFISIMLFNANEPVQVCSRVSVYDIYLCVCACVRACIYIYISAPTGGLLARW